MQEMQEPRGRAYNEGYMESSGYLADEENGGQAGQPRPNYESQQKLQPESEANLSTANYMLAILSMVASSLIMGLAIALLALTANIFGRTIGAGVIDILPDKVFGIIIASFIIALLLLLFSIAGFVFSIIQLSIMGKKRNRARAYGR